jgi:hypothetical protein
VNGRIQGLDRIADDLLETRHYVVFTSGGWLVIHPLIERYELDEQGEPRHHTCRFNWKGGYTSMRGQFWMVDETTLGGAKECP